jgi:hypothetical protein
MTGWLGLWNRFQEWVGLAQTVTPECVDDLPEILAPRKLYLIGDTGAPPWSAAMLCPCGCGSVIQLSLIRDDEPRWRAKVTSSGVISLHPSVWRTKGCRSHFFVRYGRIVWVKGSRRPPLFQIGPARR